MVHNKFLPSLNFYEAGDEEVTEMDVYYDGSKGRSRAPPLWQEAEEGTLTLPHKDYDSLEKTMGTRFGLQEGEEVVVAWHAVESRAGNSRRGRNGSSGWRCVAA